MKSTITQRQLRNDSGAVLRAVEAGSRVIVTRNGQPVAELRPVSRRTFVPRQVLTNALAGATPIDYARFRGDLDQVADQSIVAERATHE